jgi:hypothetical protein
MTEVMNYPVTRQGVRDLDHPIRPSRVNVTTDERPTSTPRAIPVGFGMRRGGLFALLLGALGGFLVYRWVTRHSSAGIKTTR